MFSPERQGKKIMGWVVGIVGLLALLASKGGNQLPQTGGLPAPNHPKPKPAPAPMVPLPSIDQLAPVICALFMSTHAAAPPMDIVAAAYSSFGVTQAMMVAGSSDVHTAAVKLATGLYNGSIQCEDDGKDPYAASTKVCQLTGKAYNAAVWHSPAVVYDELHALGFAGAKGTSAQRKQAVKNFQAVARSLGLGGMGGAPPSFIDGIIGACTLLALDEARFRRQTGSWNPAIAQAASGPNLGQVAEEPTPKLGSN
jgi:hypothetical protein